MPFSQKGRNDWTIFIILIVISTLIVFITPEIISFLLFNRENSIVFISYGKTFILYFINFIISIIALFYCYFFKQFITKIFISFFGLFLLFYVNFVGIQHSFYFDEKLIEYTPLFGSTERYEWSNITRVYHELPTEEYVEKYIFEFKDGDTFELIVTSVFSKEIMTKIVDKIMTLEASYEEY